ncbi:MAG: hypothetical protein P1U46_02360 [Patescibacteria group bacterium]|nr:hypothetical protein [Patescibacteria group bacterium]
MSENPNRNYELDQNIIPPCESGIKDECTKYNPPKERYELHDKNILFDEN